ncbi:MAG TPA: shikimate dehydrogenase [Streptosporangiaceae bacterium]
MAVHRAAVLGRPIAHSLSPVLHLAGYQELGLTDWSYQAIECDEAGLPALLQSLGPDWAGLSLTMPLKQVVLPLLDRADPLVGTVGAANTVLLRQGERVGCNTDVAGIVTALRLAGVTPAGNVALLGSGATARSGLAALSEAGWGEVAVAVRDRARADPLLAVAKRLGVSVNLMGLGQDLSGTRWRLLLSTLPAGAADDLADRLTASELAATAVFDVVYDPWPTRLAAAALASGSTVISGFDMLLHQATGQFELMTGKPAPVETMRAAGLAELDRRHGLGARSSGNAGPAQMG